MKKVQIDEALFMSLCRFHLLEDTTQAESIKNGLQGKLDALAKRQLYTDSKTADTPEERENARQAYLDKVGISQDWRW